MSAGPPDSIDGTDTPQPSARAIVLIARAMPWVARLAWVVVAIVGGAAIESAVAGRSDAVRWVVGIGAWGVFGVVALALVIPSVWSLTVSRVLAPLALVATAV
ncbi:MAG: hypothetical protein AAGG08_07075, partial [Actinomycetota bacterium]